MDVSLKERLLSKDRWLRLLFMVVFAIAGWVVQYVIWGIALVQAVIGFVTGNPNQTLLHFGKSLSTFFYQIVKFLTYSSEEKPYPFTPWPGSSKEVE